MFLSLCIHFPPNLKEASYQFKAKLERRKCPKCSEMLHWPLLFIFRWLSLDLLSYLCFLYRRCHTYISLAGRAQSSLSESMCIWLVTLPTMFYGSGCAFNFFAHLILRPTQWDSTLLGAHRRIPFWGLRPQENTNVNKTLPQWTLYCLLT